GLFRKVVPGGKHHPRAIQVDVSPSHTFQGQLEIRLHPQRKSTRSLEVQARGEGADSKPQCRRLLARPAIDGARIRRIKMVIVLFASYKVTRHSRAREQARAPGAHDIK